MFAGLKNKIKEETGSDVTKLPVLTTNPNLSTSRGQHSRQGSSSSVFSNVSLDGSKEECPSSPTFQKKQDFKVAASKELKQLEKREDEWRKKLEKKEEEWKKKLQKRETEWQKTMDEKSLEWQKEVEILRTEKNILEEEKLDVVRQKLSLEEALRSAEEYKKKVLQYREDVDQFEGLQTQEMAKIKHLLLVKEQEVTDKVNSLKEATSQIEELKSEVNRLRRYEEEFTDLQEVLLKEKVKLEEAASQSERLSIECAQLHALLDSERTLRSQLEEESKRMRAELELEKKKILQLEEETRKLQLNLEDSTSTLSHLQEESARLRSDSEKEKSQHIVVLEQLRNERAEKEEALVRNAEVNQQAELARQESREAGREISELRHRLEESESELRHLTSRVTELEGIEHDKVSASSVEQELRSNIQSLEDQLAEKNKNIRVLQQHLGDMKKTLQKELKQNADPSPNSCETDSPNSVIRRPDEDCVEFIYLKHVLMKFLTSREYEAQHLTRAVATLLRFSEEEERLLKETLEWKMSWFGTRPRLGAGQTSKTIPHS